MKRELLQHPASNSRFAGRLALFGAVAAGLTAAWGQSTPVPLVPVVVTATRLPESEAVVGTAIDTISGSDLQREQLSTLADALSGIPDTPAFATGQAGAATSLFLRGANSDQVLFLVDGIRINDANTDYANFLGGAHLFPSDNVEVARGPQSTLYGSDASGGVVSLSLAEGKGAPSGAFEAEAGAFSTVDGEITAQGAKGSWAYNLGLAAERTENDRINNAFRSGDLAGRIDWRAAKYLAVGATLRGFVSHYGDPGDEFTDNPYNYETESNWLGTVYCDARLTQYLSSHLTVGGQDRDYGADVPTPGQPTQVTTVRNRRGVIDWQNTAQLTAKNRLVAGLTAENETTLDTGFGSIDRRQSLYAFYGEDEWALPGNLHLTGGLRRDDYSTFGAASTGRLTAAWLPLGSLLKLRSSYGTGFNAPSFLDLYGQATGYAGNPQLQPERSRGWDFGLDLYGGSRGTLSATWFTTEFRNLIVDNFNVSPATTLNVGRARTRGVELAYSATLAGIVQAKFAYTRLEADDLTDGTPLLRRPHYSASADFWCMLGGGWSAGVGAGWVGTRADIDPQSYATIYDPAYAVARVYAAWAVTPRLTLKARMENAFDRRYEPVAGYPQPGRAVFGGAQWSF